MSDSDRPNLLDPVVLRSDPFNVEPSPARLRADMLAVRHVPGDPWGPGPIGNAEWSGVALGEVLRAAGVDGSSMDRHVAFASHDKGGETCNFGVPIPLADAIVPETLLAFAMNGEPLTPEHGFPVRVVTPG